MMGSPSSAFARRIRARGLARGAVVVLLVGYACVPELTLPRCVIVSDCPPCEGWVSCRDGRCFRFGGEPWDDAICAAAPACSSKTGPSVEPDQCCPLSLEAEQDPDCSAGTVTIEGASAVGAPAVLGDAIFVSAGIGGQVVLARATVDGEVSSRDLGVPVVSLDLAEPVVAGCGSGDRAVLVATPGGICRFSADSLETEWDCGTSGGTPVLPPLPLSDGRIAVPTAGQLRFLDTAGATTSTLTMGASVTAAASTPDGLRLYVGLDDGCVAGVAAGDAPAEIWRTPLGQTAQSISVGSAGFAVFVDGKGVLHRLREGTGAHTQYAPADGLPAGEVVVDSFDRLVAAGASSAPVAVQLTKSGFEARGSVATTGTLRGTALVSDLGRVFFLAGDAVAGFAWEGAVLVPRWRFAGLGGEGTSMNLTPSGTLVVVVPPDRLRLLLPGAGGLADTAWARHRCTAGATGGFRPSCPQ